MWDLKAISAYTMEINHNPMSSKLCTLANATNLKPGYVMFERGHEQRNWIDKIPNRCEWPHGVRLISRKDYRNHMYWLKYSKSMLSGIMINLPWAMSIVRTAYPGDHCLPFETCSTFFNLSWSVIDANRGQFVFTAENDDWNEIINALRRC